jgi:septum site-determining protein MinC
VDWLADLDSSLQRSEGFFADHPVALDLSGVNLSSAAIGHLVASLKERGINVLGIEGVDPANWQAGLPPVLSRGRGTRAVDLPGHPASATPAPAAACPVPQKQQLASLMIGEPVRSGQSVVFVEGDVTVVGSVGSGAEIVAGGSIHVYGTLRGRALAGPRATPARIFCHRVEAELLAINSY